VVIGGRRDGVESEVESEGKSKSKRDRVRVRSFISCVRAGRRNSFAAGSELAR
jgi:hypothetical protein